MDVVVDIGYIFIKYSVYYTGLSVYYTYKYLRDGYAPKNKLETELEEIKLLLQEKSESETDDLCINKRLRNDETKDVICCICDNVIASKNEMQGSFYKDCSIIYTSDSTTPQLSHVECVKEKFSSE